MGYFFSKPSSPPTIATDKVVPFHFWDDNKMLRPVVPEVTLSFDDALDVAKIRSAIQQLLEREGWRKLGARMRMNKNGKLEYHIPQSYTEKRPGFVLTEKKYDIRIEEHPLGSKLPRPAVANKNKPIFVGDPMTFTPILRSPSAPTSLDGWLYHDIPQLVFHAACFENATLFTITWAHTLMDAMSLSAILNAISLILQGKEDQIPVFLGADTDPLVSMGKDADPKNFLLYEHLLTGFASVRFGISLALDLLINRKNSLRQICIPASYFKRLYTEARSELSLNTDLNEHRDVPTAPEDNFVSESDVLSAWWFRTLLTALQPRKNASITILNVFDFRSLVTPDLLSAKGIYIGNGNLGLFTLLPAWQILSSPISFLAQSLRRSLNTQRTRPQLDAMAATHKMSFEKSGFGAMFGSPDQHLLVVSNWHRAKLYNIDFSAAIVDSSRKESNPMAGKPTYIHPVAYNNGFSIRNFGAVSGKDHEENWWFSWYTGDDTWDLIEKELSK